MPSFGDAYIHIGFFPIRIFFFFFFYMNNHNQAEISQIFKDMPRTFLGWESVKIVFYLFILLWFLHLAEYTRQALLLSHKLGFFMRSMFRVFKTHNWERGTYFNSSDEDGKYLSKLPDKSWMDKIFDWTENFFHRHCKDPAHSCYLK